MALVSNEEINAIRAKADIISIVGSYIPLTQRGKNYFCVCPFHDDHSPSMSLSTEKQIYKCFSCGATGNVFTGEILGMHPITFMMVVGIAFQALAECFISPRYLEYFSLQAPKGEEGVYLGFSHLHSFLSSILGFGLSGILLSKYCPDPNGFETVEAWQAASVNAHYIWYWFAAIGLISAFALIIYARVNKSKD